MDDFNVSSLHESKNEWGARLLTILTPVMIEGFQSIFEEAHNLCKTNEETSKYLMTFQNLITRIPKWNPAIIEGERLRIVEKSGCHYLEDLITCVHIIQLKLLTAMRAGQKQKKIDINVPKVCDFVHKAYIHAARKIYKNVYLYELNIPPLQTQKNNREIEILIQESILNAVRESIPVESILRAYLDESVEDDVVEEVMEQVSHEKTVATDPAPTAKTPVVQALPSQASPSQASASVSVIPEYVPSVPVAKPAITPSYFGSKPDDSDRIKIFTEPMELSNLDVHVIAPPPVELKDSNLLNEIEVLA
jgi:hypothetical protein